MVKSNYFHVKEFRTSCNPPNPVTDNVFPVQQLPLRKLCFVIQLAKICSLSELVCLAFVTSDIGKC